MQIDRLPACGSSLPRLPCRTGTDWLIFDGPGVLPRDSGCHGGPHPDAHRDFCAHTSYVDNPPVKTRAQSRDPSPQPLIPNPYLPVNTRIKRCTWIADSSFKVLSPSIRFLASLDNS